jgi:DtxR family Mn-dependent transcriptional regulator
MADQPSKRNGKRGASGEPSATVEDYLHIIYYMNRDGRPIFGARLAEKLGVSPPTVAQTLKRMRDAGLTWLDGRKEVQLTERGRELAERIVRRHALAEHLLVDLLGLRWAEAHREAHHVEHAISPRIEERLLEVLGHPRTCPHGNPMPGAEQEETGAVTLPTLREGQRGVVTRIHEEAEEDLRLLTFLEEHGVKPGAAVVVDEVAGYNGTVTLRVDERPVVLGERSAGHIWIKPVPSS